jgi:4-hydroxy-tetrahydrodipicolinate reductase
MPVQQHALSTVPVVCLGLGPIGLRLATRLVDQSGVEVVAGVDVDTDRTGSALGPLIDRPDLTVPVHARLDQVTGTGGVVVQATVSDSARAAEQMLEAVALGWNVVSTCEQLVFPAPTDTELVARLDAAAREAGVSVLASGINPGFLMDSLPLTLTAACVSVDRVRVTRVVDTDQRRVPLQQKAGVGLTADQFEERRAAGRLGHVGLRQSAELLAAGLGWTIDHYEETLEPVIASRAIETGLGPVPEGGVLGQHQVVEAHCAGRVVITYDLEMSAGAEPVDQIQVDGDPSITQTISGGVNGDIGTIAVMSNLVPVVAAAPPGFLTMTDISPLHVRG